ncbi:hypothetical protein [Atribacter sp.]|jgi:hypothetical protein|uniref:hypothetical protein n=1 Tax=Atribacter sp. TaxID=2847780 RepID=UPI00345F144C
MVERLGKGLGDSLGLSLTYSASKVVNSVEFVISDRDKEILRTLAKKVAEISARPIESEKRKLWYQHNDLEDTRPLIFCDPENGWYEIIPHDQLACKGDLARIWEFKLRKEIFWGEKMNDDRVIEPIFKVQYAFQEFNRGMQESIIGGANNGSYCWDAPLKDYSELESLHFQKIDVDDGRTDQLYNLAREIFANILKVELEGYWWWSFGLTWSLVNLRGIQQVMLDMYDHPQELHQLMAFLRDEALSLLDFLEMNNLLSLNNQGTYVGSGGFGYTHQLPQKDYDRTKVRTQDMWGFSESQETVLVSPNLFAEFIFPYQLPILERFGLNCYGCCEPIDKRWHIVSQAPRLRRVSVSAWANVRDLAEKLGKNYVFSRKPNPSDLSYPKIDEEYIRKGLRETLEAAQGCHVELIMKDNHTIGRNPENVIQWCRIAREEAERIMG